MMRRRLPALLLGALLLLPTACSREEKHPILVGQDRITVTNMTGEAWSDVDVWLNDHYRIQVPGLAAGQRADLPIGVFVAGFGQRFDPKKQVPFGVEVDARGADGKPVTLIWGKGRRR